MWPDVEIWLRADSGFTRDDMMAWCEENRVEYVFGMAKNKRLTARIAAEMEEAKAVCEATKKPACVFKQLDYRTTKSWLKSRRVIAKAEHLEKGSRRLRPHPHQDRRRPAGPMPCRPWTRSPTSISCHLRGWMWREQEQAYATARQHHNCGNDVSLGTTDNSHLRGSLNLRGYSTRYVLM